MSNGLEIGEIGKVAKAPGLPLDAIRFYQRIGLVRAPARTIAGHRVFCAPDRAKGDISYRE